MDWTEYTTNGEGSEFEGTKAPTKEGFHTSSADHVPNGGKGRDSNRRKNHEKKSKNKTVTAHITLRGYPLLKSKKDVTILNVGPRASGQYYVESVHTYESSRGLITEAELSRGSKSGDSNSKNNNMCCFADIYQPGKIFVKPRPCGVENQATFVFGDGQYLIKFVWKLNPQPNRGGNEGAEKGDNSGGGSGGTPAKSGDKESGPGGVNVRKEKSSDNSGGGDDAVNNVYKYTDDLYFGET